MAARQTVRGPIPQRTRSAGRLSETGSCSALRVGSTPTAVMEFMCAPTFPVAGTALPGRCCCARRPSNPAWKPRNPGADQRSVTAHWPAAPEISVPPLPSRWLITAWMFSSRLRRSLYGSARRQSAGPTGESMLPPAPGSGSAGPPIGPGDSGFPAGPRCRRTDAAPGHPDQVPATEVGMREDQASNRVGSSAPRPKPYPEAS